MICMIWIVLNGRKIGRYIRRQKSIRVKKRNDTLLFFFLLFYLFKRKYPCWCPSS